MGFGMKKIAKFGCGEICYNGQYICTGGNKIGVIDPKTDKICATLTGIKNISSLSMDENYVYAKSTSGVYGMFDLKTFTLTQKGSCRARERTAHDGDFFCIDEGVVLDVLTFKDENMYAVKYNFLMDKSEHVLLTDNMFTCFHRVYDKNERKAYFLCREKSIVVKPSVYCQFYIINVDDLSTEKLDLTFDKGDNIPRYLVTSDLILINGMELQNIHTGERFPFGFSECIKNDIHGYFRKAKLFGDILILVYSETILLFDMQKKKFIKEYHCDYCENAVLINNKLYISTWNGFFLADEY